MAGVGKNIYEECTQDSFQFTQQIFIKLWTHSEGRGGKENSPVLELTVLKHINNQNL